MDSSVRICVAVLPNGEYITLVYTYYTLYMQTQEKTLNLEPSLPLLKGVTFTISPIYYLPLLKLGKYK